MMRRHFKVRMPTRMRAAKLTIDPGREMVTVRFYRERQTYTLPLVTVVQMIRDRAAKADAISAMSPRRSRVARGILCRV